jgi:hypothetical protein
MTSQTKTDEIFLDQKNEQQIIVNKYYDIQTNLFPGPEEYTSWETRIKYVGLLNPENQLQMNPMKLDGIDIWPTPTTTKEVKSFLVFGNFDK